MKSPKCAAKLHYFFETHKFFRIFAGKQVYVFMKIKKMNAIIVKSALYKFFNIHLLYAGVLLMLISYFTGLINHNWILLVSVLLVLSGAFGYILHEK